jgi:hypothetical protein
MADETPGCVMAREVICWNHITNLATLVKASVTKSATFFAALMCVAHIAQAESCEDVGKLGFVLTEIDSNCPGYKLSKQGRRDYESVLNRLIALGGKTCADAGRTKFLKDTIQDERIKKLGLAGDEDGLAGALCDAYAIYLVNIGKSALIDQRKSVAAYVSSEGQPICKTAKDLHTYTTAELIGDTKAKYECAFVKKGLRMNVIDRISKSDIGGVIKVQLPSSGSGYTFDIGLKPWR